jgi:hypothetical protein
MKETCLPWPSRVSADSGLFKCTRLNLIFEINCEKDVLFVFGRNEIRHRVLPSCAFFPFYPRIRGNGELFYSLNAVNQPTDVAGLAFVPLEHKTSTAELGRLNLLC